MRGQEWAPRFLLILGPDLWESRQAVPCRTQRISDKTMRTSLLGIIVAASLATACGRTPLLPPTCMLQADAQALDFGDVEPGGRSVRSVTLTNLGQGMCSVPAPTMGESTDPAFSVAGMPRSPMLVSPGQ